MPESGITSLINSKSSVGHPVGTSLTKVHPYCASLKINLISSQMDGHTEATVT